MVWLPKTPGFERFLHFGPSFPVVGGDFPSAFGAAPPLYEMMKV
jgi:hypothetical protein